ncbi:conserved Plasmodium protein, unknown function [Plasmodium relictum]|uniref:SUN domain-containing protein n=1 Tax=Plasmodium relictum TaxID=85471 RepID=A0A1J1HDN1_PLARL|nr:conserved Plasmodium protein, unknown function [Plasmodium relictum]CRH01533.1 conserved Plasmodium protein, unknown function [Plasmodium relictum]
MIWWFLISINFLFFLLKSFFTPKDLTNLNEIYNSQANSSSEKYILGEDYNLINLKLKVDFGSLDTGTKIIEYSKGIINIKSIQQFDYDSYMLTPCKSDIWWVYSFSDIIHIEKIGLVSLEHYASNFKVIEILGSDIYPTRKWKKLGKISTNFTKSFELFNILEYCKNYEDNCWVKYLKINVLSHHNIENNYYCTLTHLQIFASSGVDMLSDKIYSDEKINENEKELQDKYVSEKNEETHDKEKFQALEKDYVKKELKGKELGKKELEEIKKKNHKEEYSPDNFFKNIGEDKEKGEKENKDDKEYIEESDKEGAEDDTIINEKEINKHSKNNEMKNNISESENINNMKNINNNVSFTKLNNENSIVKYEDKLYNSYFFLNNTMNRKYKTFKTLNKLRLSNIFKNSIFRRHKNIINKFFYYNILFKKKYIFKYNGNNLVNIMKNNYPYKNNKKFIKKNTSYEKKMITKKYSSFRKKLFSSLHLILKIFINSNNYFSSRSKMPEKKNKSYIVNNDHSSLKKVNIPLIRSIFINRILCNNNISCSYNEVKKFKKFIKHEYSSRKSNIINYFPSYTKKRLRKITRVKKNKECNIFKNIFLLREINKINKEWISDYYDKINIKYNKKFYTHKKDIMHNISDKRFKNKKIIRNKIDIYYLNPSKNYIIWYIISILKKNNTYNSKLIKYCIDLILSRKTNGKAISIIYSFKKKKLVNYLYKKIKCYNILNYYEVVKKKRMIASKEHIFNKKYKTGKRHSLMGDNHIINNRYNNKDIKNTKKCNKKYDQNIDIFIYKKPDISYLILFFHKIIEKGLLFNYHVNSLTHNKNRFENNRKFFYSMWDNLFDKEKLSKVIKLNEDHVLDLLRNYIEVQCKMNHFFNNAKGRYTLSKKKYILSHFFYRINKKKLSSNFSYFKICEKKSKNVIYLCVRYYINSVYKRVIINHIKFLKKQNILQTEDKNIIENFNNKKKIKKLSTKLNIEKKNNVNSIISLIFRKKYLEKSKNLQDICLTTDDMNNIIYSDKDLKEYSDENSIKNIEKEKLKNLVNIDYQDNNENSIKILNEIKKNEEINNKLINDIYDIINEYDINDNDIENYSVKLKTGKNISLIVNKEDKKENIGNKKNKEEKLNYFEEFDQIIDENINFNELNCVGEEKIEEKAKNSRGHALLTLVDKVKTIENKNNYVVSKLKDIIKITNNKTKIIYQMLLNFKILQNKINLLLKYIMINEKNMKDLNRNRKSMENFFKVMKEICILQINDKSNNMNSLKHICKYLQDFLYDELEKKYYFEKIRGTFPFCNSTENILLRNKDVFDKKNPNFILKEKKRNSFNFFYYENHCHTDIFKTPLLYYNSPVDSIQGFYFRIFKFFKTLNFLKFLLLRIKYCRNLFFRYIKNENNFYVLFIYIFLIIFIINNFLCYIFYKHLSNKLNACINNCNCHNK